MKQTKLVILGILLSIIALPAAEAREHTHKKRTSHAEEAIEYGQAAPESVYTATRADQFGLGFSTYQNAPTNQNSSTLIGTAAITGIYNLSNLDQIQGFFSIPQTSPFNVTFGSLYKRTISQYKGAGFHVGGGFGLGNYNTTTYNDQSASSFTLGISAIGGFHFEMPGVNHILVQLDGGPFFTLVNTSPNAKTNFQVGALSPALGASVLYVF
jgi:hypothetical protein